MGLNRTSLETFGEKLRWWRNQRRLSQLGLALDVGISQRHLSFLETGRASPSREAVLRLGSALRLPLRGQNALLISAGFAPCFPDSAATERRSKEADRAVSLLLKHHEPFPAIVVDRRWNLLMANRAAHRFFGMFAGANPTSPSENINVVRLLSAPDGLQRAISNWQETRRNLVELILGDLDQHPDDPELHNLLGLLAGDQDQAAVRPDRNASPPPIFVLALASSGIMARLSTVISRFGSPGDVGLAELRVETFFPADEQTEVLFRSSAETSRDAGAIPTE